MSFVGRGSDMRPAGVVRPSPRINLGIPQQRWARDVTGRVHAGVIPCVGNTARPDARISRAFRTLRSWEDVLFGCAIALVFAVWAFLIGGLAQ